MADKHILIADADVKAWDELRLILGDAWVVTGAADANAAAAAAKKQNFDVVLANFDLPPSGGAKLLNRIRTSSPTAVRFVIAVEAFKEKAMHHVLGGHQFLSIPFDHAALKSAIERSVAVNYGMSNSLRELVSRIRTFPSIPSIYVEVTNALKNPNAMTGEIGAIIAKDLAMTTKLMRVLNSAYFGLSRRITDPTEAVGLLGFETVKSLIVTIKLFSQYDKVKPVYFSIDSIWRHSTNVARTARSLALQVTGDSECGSAAYTAGLMHDLGKVILAANFDGTYQGAHNVARKQKIALWEVEKDLFGATHGEIGAYLLSLWGMSAEIIDAAAFHHHPSSAPKKIFNPLTAVHVANALEYEGIAEQDGLPTSVIDMEYLRELGLEGSLEGWRQARLEPGATKFETKSQPAEPAATAPQPAKMEAKPQRVKSVAAAPRPRKEAAKESPRKPSMRPKPWRGLQIALGVSAVTGLAWYGMMQLEQSAARRGSGKIASTQSPTAQPKAALLPKAQSQTTPVMAATNMSAPVPPSNAPSLAAAHPSAPPAPVPPKSPLDLLKVKAIFYSSQNPSALINGTLARVDEMVAGCRVLSITATSVTLENQGERKTFMIGR